MIYLQFVTSKRAISIRYKLIMNIISMKDFYGYKRYVNLIIWEAVTCSIVSVRMRCHSLGKRYLQE